MVGSAGEGEIVHARDLACGVVGDVVHFAEVTGYVTTGCCARTVLGMKVTVVHWRWTIRPR
jgi:hypothetical protein